MDYKKSILQPTTFLHPASSSPFPFLFLNPGGQKGRSSHRGGGVLLGKGSGICMLLQTPGGWGPAPIYAAWNMCQ